MVLNLVLLQLRYRGCRSLNLVAGTDATTYGARLVNLVAKFKENHFLPRNNILPYVSSTMTPAKVKLVGANPQ